MINMWKYLLLPFIIGQALVITQTIPGLFGKPDHFHSLPLIDDASLLLHIKGKHEARIWLCPDEYPMINETHLKNSNRRVIKYNTKKINPCDAGIEVLFGSTSNQYITIRDHWYVSETSTFISPLYHGNVLDEDEFRPFWINWIDNEVTVGFGHSIYKQLILSYREDSISSSSSWKIIPSHSYHLSKIAFSSWEEPITFICYMYRGIRHPFPTFSTSSEYEQFGQHDNIIKLSTIMFQVIIECQGLSECNMAFLQTYQWKTEDTKAIEIVLHDAFERRHLYPRNIIRLGTGLGGLILDESNETVLSSNEFRPFWIQWLQTDNNQGLMLIGKGIHIGKEIFLSAYTSFSTSFVYMGFSSYFLSTSVRILYVSSNDKQLYSFDKRFYQVIKKIEKTNIKPLTFSYGTTSMNRGFRVSSVTQECPRLTICNPPSTTIYSYSVSLPVLPRIQWWNNGAYCAEVSIQTVLLSKGIYMSQAWIRKHSPYSGNKAFFGDELLGYEIVPGNIEQALQQLHLSYERWKGTDVMYFFQWIKRNLIKGYPIVWFVQSSTSTYVEHAEPVVGYFSKYPLHHKRVYPDDILRYHNNIELLSYYRRVDSFVDKGKYDNCTQGLSFGTECISPNYQFAVAIHGMKRFKKIPSDIIVQLQLSDGGMEGKKWIYATVIIKNIKSNLPYLLTRYSYLHSPIHTVFKSNTTTFIVKDPIYIRSSEYVYYYVTLSRS